MVLNTWILSGFRLAVFVIGKIPTTISSLSFIGIAEETEKLRLNINENPFTEVAFSE